MELTIFANGPFEIYPAIDRRQGMGVRLRTGDLANRPLTR